MNCGTLWPGFVAEGITVLPNHIAVFSWLVFGLLFLFTLRRFWLLIAAARPVRYSERGDERSVAAIASVLNEEENLPGLLEALDNLDYSQDKIFFLLVDDGSRDRTSGILQAWAGRRANARCLVLSQSLGKAEALNKAVEAAPESELIAVYDADLRPQSDSLRILASAFRDERIGAVSGFRRPANASASTVAAYGALETLVHQLITQSGKETLGLNPTTLGGNCVYRRSALQQIGGFPAGAFSEDIEISHALVAEGWRTRFLIDAVAHSLVVESLGRYWNQRCRWTRGLYRSHRRASGMESWLVSAGYLDRLAFLAALVLTGAGHISILWPAIYCMGHAASIASALGRANLGAAPTVRMLRSILPMFAVDVSVSFTATVSSLLGRHQQWRTGGASR